MIDYNERNPNTNSLRYIVRFTNDEGACLFDTVTQTYPRDADGSRIRVDRNTGKPLGVIERCPTCGVAKRKMLP